MFSHLDRHPGLLIAIGITAKIAGALVMSYFYLVHQNGGDTWNYFQEGMRLRELFLNDFDQFWYFFLDSRESASGVFYNEPRALFFSKIIGLLLIPLMGNYWLLTLTFAVISFLASWKLYLRLKELFGNWGVWYGSLMLFPSFLFWTSGIQKETVVMICVSGLLVIGLKVYETIYRFRLFDAFIAVVLLLLLMNLKYYVAAVFLPVFAGMILIKLFADKLGLSSKKRQLLFLGTVVVVMGLITSLLDYNIMFSRILDRMVITHDLLYKLSSPESRIEYSNLEPSIRSFLWNSPLALLSGLFRPLPWETNSIFAVIASIENMIIFLLTIIAIGLVIWKKESPGILAICIIVYTVIIATMVTLTTPNFGTLSRYKTVWTPFLLMLDLYVCMRLFGPSFKGNGESDIVRHD